MFTVWSRSYRAQAVQLTPQNMRQVASDLGADYSAEKTSDGMVERIFYGKAVGGYGDYVVMHPDGQGGTLFNREAFLHKFVTHAERTSEDVRYAKIYELVAQAMAKQDVASYYDRGSSDDMSLVAIETTKKILGEL